MTYKQSSMTTTTRPPSQTLGFHNQSRTITKPQPKIRIIHMYAPEIINTDVANFRELVQRLTGKPTSAQGKGKDKVNDKKVNRGRIGCEKSMVNTKLEVMMMGSNNDTMRSSLSPSSSPSDHQHQHHPQHHHGVDHEDDQGFLSAFTDFDDNFDLSMLTMGSSHHHHHQHHDLNSFGETPQLSFRG